MRRDELVVVDRREDADPRVEELDHARPGRRLRPNVPGERVRELPHQRVPGRSVVTHQRLDLEEVAARASFDEVAGDRERSAAEADDRLLGRELGAHEAHRLEHRLEGVRIGYPQAPDVRGRPHRRIDTGTDALDQLHRCAHGQDGVMMSANITAASTSWRRTGWSVTSAQSSGFEAISKKPCVSRSARYSGSERPA